MKRPIFWLTLVVCIMLIAVQPRSSSAAIISSHNEGDWHYDMTDQPYQDSRLAYAIEGAKLYWGRLPDNFRVLSFSATELKENANYAEMAIGMWSRYSLDDKGAIWINAEYFRPIAKNVWPYPRSKLCMAVTHEAGHSLDPRIDEGLDPHRVRSDDPEHVMQGITPKVCRRLTEQDVIRKQRRWCKRHKKECWRKKPELARQTLKHRSHQR